MQAANLAGAVVGISMSILSLKVLFDKCTEQAFKIPLGMALPILIWIGVYNLARCFGFQ